MKKKYLVALIPALMGANDVLATPVNNINVSGLQRVERETVLSYVNIAPRK